MKAQNLILSIACLLLLVACRKEKDPEFTVQFYAYSKNVPYTIQYVDQDQNLHKETINVNAYSHSFQQTRKYFAYQLTAKNLSLQTGDSLYVRVSIGSVTDSDSRKANAWIDLSASVTSPR